VQTSSGVTGWSGSHMSDVMAVENNILLSDVEGFWLILG
jgi:hypothetical protein